jgi:Transposase domain (DUF772)
MMGRKHREQASLFYEFRLDDMIPKGHLLRRINVFVTSVLGDLHEQLGPFYSDIGRHSIDPELLIRMLIIGYCFGIRSERKLCEEVRLHLAYRWFCRLDLNDAVPHPERSLIVQWSGRFARDCADHCFTVSKGTQPPSLQAQCSLAKQAKKGGEAAISGRRALAASVKSASMARGLAAPQLDLPQGKRERTRRKRE